DLREGGDALLAELARRNRADALDPGQVVRSPLGGGEQRRGLALRLALRLGFHRLGGLGLLRRLGAAGQDLGDAHRGQELAMAALAARVLTAALLEGDDLRAAALLDDLGGDRGAVDKRRADGEIGAVANSEHLVELDRAA